MIPEYTRKRTGFLDMEQLKEDMPEIVEAIEAQSVWEQYEQKPDFNDIPEEFKSMIPQNAYDLTEDNKVYNIWLTKK